MPEVYQYEIALSFAGEDRAKVDPIANKLKALGVSVFYDDFEPSELWGKDLTIHLSELYLKKARFFIPFISRHYAEKIWPAHELKSALARALQSKGEYILPIRLDETEIPGILPTVHYVNYTKSTQDQIVEMILAKIDAASESASSFRSQSSPGPKFGLIPIPKVKKAFTQRERDKFGQEAFFLVSQYFEEALKQLDASDADIETEFTLIHRYKFVCKIYVKGEIANACKIWFGGPGHGGTDRINYASGKQIDINSDNSYNDVLSVGDDGNQLVLKASGSGFQTRTQPSESGTVEAAAGNLWKRFVEPIEHKR